MISSVNNFVNYQTAVIVVPTLGRAVLRLRGFVPLDEVRRWLEALVVHFLERVQVVLDSEFLLGKILVDDEVETRLKLVGGSHPGTFAWVVHPGGVAFLLVDPLLVQLSACFLLEVFCVREGFLDLLGADDADIIARDFVHGVDGLSAIQLPEYVRPERVIRHRVTRLVTQDHLADRVVDFDFTVAELCFEFSRRDLAFGELLNRGGDVILEVVDRRSLRLDKTRLPFSAAVMAYAEIHGGDLGGVDSLPLFAEPKALKTVKGMRHLLW